MVPASPGEALRTPTAVTSLSTSVRVSTGSGVPGEADVDHPLARLDQVEGQRRQAGRVGGVDDRVERQRREAVRGPDAVRSRACGRSPSDRRRQAQRWTSAPWARREQRDEQADRARPEHQQPVPRRQRRRPDGPQRVAARLDQGPGRRVDRVRQRVQRRGRHQPAARPGRRATRRGCRSRSGPRTRAAPAQAAAAPAAAEHGVAGDPPADPGLVDAVADGGDGPAPLVPEPHRVFGVALVQVGHLAGEELHVGAAHTDPLDVDHDLARRRRPGARRPAPRTGGAR